jgi:hypothetical protein
LLRPKSRFKPNNLQKARHWNDLLVAFKQPGDFFNSRKDLSQREWCEWANDANKIWKIFVKFGAFVPPVPPVLRSLQGILCRAFSAGRSFQGVLSGFVMKKLLIYKDVRWPNWNNEGNPWEICDTINDISPFGERVIVIQYSSPSHLGGIRNPKFPEQLAPDC